ncbi:MAG: pyridoxal 5'-phosphate synthase glutaminase subunit PdxT [Brevefilum sp.]|nr:pyridoxal 5'-phosphate synthase glutaminase subunit PdxT [Brevefilum sp.]MDT8382536.1 pyridoxal 5'-phosphate synthase glutaminase subunit PdxT [Brevefilum sp.]
MRKTMNIGVLALQGDFHEHTKVLQSIGVSSRLVKLPRDLTGLDGLIIPGGESTTIGKLAEDYDLIEPLRQFGQLHAIWGTCAGAIFLSKDVKRDQPLLRLMDIEVQRNAFGRQVDSFEIDLQAPFLEYGESQPYHAVFIRAPMIKSVYGKAEILLKLPDGAIVAAKQGRLLATSFHPELTEDDRFHRYFVELTQS